MKKLPERKVMDIITIIDKYLFENFKPKSYQMIPDILIDIRKLFGLELFPNPNFKKNRPYFLFNGNLYGINNYCWSGYPYQNTLYVTDENEPYNERHRKKQFLWEFMYKNCNPKCCIILEHLLFQKMM